MCGKFDIFYTKKPMKSLKKAQIFGAKIAFFKIDWCGKIRKSKFLV